MSEHQLMAKLRPEVDSCLEIWKDLMLEWFPGKIEYIYAKGSSVKPWHGIIDYVPTLSDVDIHVKTFTDDPLFHRNGAGFKRALEFTEELENRYKDANPNHMHMPRAQIIVVNKHMENPDFIQSFNPNSMRILYGRPEHPDETDVEKIRSVDLRNLRELETPLNSLPIAVFDRIELDFWQLIRRLCWLVSPTPTRLLTQTSRDPEAVWDSNRTTICRLLHEQGHDELVEEYTQYYLAGWLMFNTHYKDTTPMRKTLYHGYNVLEKTYHLAKEHF